MHGHYYRHGLTVDHINRCPAEYQGALHEYRPTSPPMRFAPEARSCRIAPTDSSVMRRFYCFVQDSEQNSNCLRRFTPRRDVP